MSEQFFNSWMDHESRQLSNNPLLNLSESNSTTPKTNPSPATPKLNDTVNITSIGSATTSDSKEESTYSVNALFDIYKSMAANNQFIPVSSNDPFRSSTISTPYHVEVLQRQGGGDDQQLKQQPVSDPLTSDFRSLSLNGSNSVHDKSFLAQAGSEIPSPALYASETGLQSQDTSATTQKQQQQPMNSLLGSAKQSPQLNTSRSGTPLSASQPGAGNGPPPPPPPGLSAPLMDPSQIQWYYLDPNGIQQGPFDGNMMQQWYACEYLDKTLSIRREGETSYKSLNDFALSVGDFATPFLVKLPPVQQQAGFIPQPMLKHQGSFQNFGSGSNFFGGAAVNGGFASSVLGTGTSAGSQFFGNTTNAGFLQQQSAWSTASPNILNQPIYNASSPFLQNSNLGGLKADIGFSSLVGSQTASVTSPVVNTSAPTTETQESKEAIEDPTLEAIKSKVIGDIFEDETLEAATPSTTAVEENARTGEISKPEPTKTAAYPIEALKEAKVKASPKSEVFKSPEFVKALPVAAAAVVGEVPNPKATKPVLAPWASTATKAKVLPTKSLDEIQQEEAAKRQKEIELQKKMEEEDRRLAAQLALEEASANEPEETAEFKVVKSHSNTQSQVKLPSTSKWGAGSITKAQPFKSLDEIQREEQEKTAAKVRAQAASQQQQSIAATISKQSFASAASTTSAIGGAWTVVASSAKKPAKATATPSSQRINKTPVTGLNPNLLRSVSTSSSVATEPKKPAPVIRSSATSLSPSKEFLTWCRSQLAGLYSTVNKEDVLSIMLQLPSGSESLEIIADTVYSNSSTMDGRRFAGEFNKRRTKVEDIVKKQGLYFSWSDALIANNSASNDDDDDWDMAFTKVVSKKNKRKNN